MTKKMTLKEFLKREKRLQKRRVQVFKINKGHRPRVKH